MKKIFYLGAVILAASCSSSNQEVAFNSPFEEEKVYELEVINERGQQQGLPPIQTVTKITFDVEQLDSGMIKGSWRYGATEVPGNPTEFNSDDISLYKGIELNLLYNPKTKSIELTNFQEAFGNLERAFYKLYKIDPDTDTSQMVRNLKSLFAQKSADQSSFLTNFFPEIPQLFGEIDRNYEMNKVHKTDSIPSPYGDQYVNVYSRAELEKLEGINEIFRLDSISDEELLNQLKEAMAAVYGKAMADTLPYNEMPLFKYRAEATISSNQKNQVNSVEVSKFFDNGYGEQMTTTVVNVIE